VTVFFAGKWWEETGIFRNIMARSPAKTLILNAKIFKDGKYAEM